MPWRSVLVILCASLLLAACGQKGALYFPEDSLAEQQHATPIYR